MDFIEYLPKELTDEIFTYLSAETLGRIARCSKLWRERAQNDTLWIHHCMVRGWMKYGLKWNILREEQMASPVTTNVSGNSPLFLLDVPKESSLSPMPKWKSIYLRVLHLKKNWEKGRYFVAPLLRGHRDRVTAMDCNGKVIVSGSADSSFIIWDLMTGKPLHKLNYHSDVVTAVKIKEHVIVTGCADSSIRIIDSHTGQMLLTFTGHGCGIEHLHFDGDVIVSTSAERKIRVWSLSQKKLLHTMLGHSDDIECLSVYGTLALTGSWDNTLMLWDLDTGERALTLEGHTEVINCCQFDDCKIFSGSADSTLILWSIKSGDIVRRFYGHSGEVYCCAYNKSVLISGSSDSSVRIWNYDGTCRHVLVEHIGVVRCLYLDSLVERLISGGDQKRIVVWDYKNGVCLNVVHRHPTLLHIMWVNETKLITASPEKPGTITVISYW